MSAWSTSWRFGAWRRLFWACWAALAVPLPILAGCDGGSFVPPPPPELASIPTTASSAPPTLTIEMVIRPGETPDRAVWEAAGRQEAGKSKAIFIVSRPGPSEPPAKQAELIRDAVKRKVSALIVEPADVPEVTEALHEANASGTPVVLLNRAIAPRDPARPFHLLTYAPYETALNQLLDAVMLDVRVSRIEKPHALVTQYLEGGPEAEAEAKLIQAGLVKRGVTEVGIVPFQGGYEVGRKVLTARVEADPKVQVVVAQEDQGVTAMLGTYDDTKTKRLLCLGGFMTVDPLSSPSSMNNCAGVVDRNVPGFAREAVRQALSLAQGGTAAVELQVPRPYHSRSAARTSGLITNEISSPPVAPK